MGRGKRRGSSSSIAVISDRPPAPPESQVSKSPIGFARQLVEDDGTTTGSLLFVYRDGEREVIAPGEPIAIELVGARHCQGFVNAAGERTTCPDNGEASEGGNPRCPSCKEKHHASAATVIRGQKSLRPSPEPHIVYLASIDGSEVKVGTSSSDRAAKRLGEQGARSALIIAETDCEAQALAIEKDIATFGLWARRDLKKKTKEGLEFAAVPLHDSPGPSAREGAQAPLKVRDIRDRVPASRELESLAHEIDGEVLLPGLHRLTSEISSRLGGINGRWGQLQRPEDLVPKPGEATDENRPSLSHEVKEHVFVQPSIGQCSELKTKLEPGQRLKGTLVACVGPFAVIETESGNRYAITTRSLAGWSLRPLRADEGVAEQLSLGI